MAETSGKGPSSPLLGGKFVLMKQEGSDGSGGVGGWARPPKDADQARRAVPSADKSEDGKNSSAFLTENPFALPIWPVDLPEENELRLMFDRRRYGPANGLLASVRKISKVDKNRRSERPFGKRISDQGDLGAWMSFEKKISEWKELYEKAMLLRTPCGGKRNFPGSKSEERTEDDLKIKKEDRTSKGRGRARRKRRSKASQSTSHCGIAVMDPRWQSVVGSTIEITWWSGCVVPHFKGWRKCRIEAVRWSRSDGGKPLLDLRFKGSTTMIRGVSLSRVRKPKKPKRFVVTSRRRRVAGASKKRRRSAKRQGSSKKARSSNSKGDALVTQESLPDGWTAKSHVRSGGGMYYVYVAPDGTRHRSIAAVNRYLGHLPARKTSVAKDDDNDASTESDDVGGKFGCSYCGRSFPEHKELIRHLHVCEADVEWTSYITVSDDETLTMISKIAGAPSVSDLVQANTDVYPGIRPSSRLRLGTEIFLVPLMGAGPSTLKNIANGQTVAPTLSQWTGPPPEVGDDVEALWAGGTDPDYPSYIPAKIKHVRSSSTGIVVHLAYPDGGEDTEVPLRHMRRCQDNMRRTASSGTSSAKTSSNAATKAQSGDATGMRKSKDKKSKKSKKKKQKKSGSSGRPRSARRVRCGECEGCTRRDDCRECSYCLDKPKYGGPGRLKQSCKFRRCSSLRRVA